MPFPIPEPSSTESADARRDEDKRLRSPPSSFYAQSQTILTAVRYFEPLNSGYEGTAQKHRNRLRSALFVQLMAAFEFAMKDFIAQTIDATHIYDDEVKGWTWLSLDLVSVMSTREGAGRLGAILVHPLAGWQTPEVLNGRYKDIYQREPIASAEIPQIRDLWIIRHSVAHNGGFVTRPDARRLRSTALRERQVLIDLPYLEGTAELLRGIVARLESVVGPALLRKWFSAGAAGDWTQDKEDYQRLKLLTTYVRSRPQELPAVNEAMYLSDLAAYKP